jgi:hypothetical protein
VRSVDNIPPLTDRRSTTTLVTQRDRLATSALSANPSAFKVEHSLIGGSIVVLSPNLTSSRNDVCPARNIMGSCTDSAFPALGHYESW